MTNHQASTCAVLGYGTMGSLLARLLADRGAGPIVVANRSPGRLEHDLPEGVSRAPFAEAVAQASVVFLCVKPQACIEVLRLVSPAAAEHTLLVSVAGDVALDLLRSAWPGPVVRMMPTVTAAVGRGTNLLCGHPEATARVRRLFSPDLRFLEIPEDRWNALAAITSCGPGLVSALMRTWCDDLASRAGLTTAEAEALVAETVAATLALRAQPHQDFGSILASVASPGGVTGEGARVLGERMPEVWSEVARAMETRHRAREEAVKRSFAGNLPSS